MKSFAFFLILATAPVWAAEETPSTKPVFLLPPVSARVLLDSRQREIEALVMEERGEALRSDIPAALAEAEKTLEESAKSDTAMVQWKKETAALAIVRQLSVKTLSSDEKAKELLNTLSRSKFDPVAETAIYLQNAGEAFEKSQFKQPVVADSPVFALSQPKSPPARLTERAEAVYKHRLSCVFEAEQRPNNIDLRLENRIFQIRCKEKDVQHLLRCQKSLETHRVYCNAVLKEADDATRTELSAPVPCWELKWDALLERYRSAHTKMAQDIKQEGGDIYEEAEEALAEKLLP